MAGHSVHSVVHQIMLANRDITQMRTRGQRTVLEIRNCKMQPFMVVTCFFWGQFESNLLYAEVYRVARVRENEKGFKQGKSENLRKRVKSGNLIGGLIL